MNRRWYLLVAAALLLAACKSGSGNGAASGSAHELKDPRTVPTATLPAQIPSPVPAVDVSQTISRPAASATPAGGNGAAGPNVYVVQSGDTPTAIARALGVSVDDLLRVNNITDPKSLKIGQQLTVPRPGQASPTAAASGTARAAGTTGAASATSARSTTSPPATATRAASAAATPARAATAAPGGTAGTYTVVEGDTGCGIARKLGVPLTALAQANGTSIEGLASLRVGQSLKVPATQGPSGC